MSFSAESSYVLIVEGQALNFIVVGTRMWRGFLNWILVGVGIIVGDEKTYCDQYDFFADAIFFSSSRVRRKSIGLCPAVGAIYRYSRENGRRFVVRRPGR